MKTKAVKRAEAIERNSKHVARNTGRIGKEHPNLNEAGVRQIVQHMQGVPKKDRV